MTRKILFLDRSLNIWLRVDLVQLEDVKTIILASSGCCESFFPADVILLKPSVHSHPLPLSLSLLSLSLSLAGVTCRFRDRSGFQLPFGRFHRNSDEHGHRDGGEIVSRCMSILKFFFSLLCGQGGTCSSHDYFELVKSKYSLD